MLFRHQHIVDDRTAILFPTRRHILSTINLVGYSLLCDVGYSLLCDVSYSLVCSVGYSQLCVGYSIVCDVKS